MASADRPTLYQNGVHRIDLSRREVRISGAVSPIGARAFEILELLVVRAPELVTKDELMRQVWPGAVVEENTLQVQISGVRKALGRERGMLKTEAGRGYRLLGDWTTDNAGPSPRAPPSERLPATATAWRDDIPPASRLIGRDGAIMQVRRLLSASRLVTLTGPGGIGKTALAAEVMRTMLPHFPGQGCNVDLAVTSDPDLVPSAVARAAGLKHTGNETSAEDIARAIGPTRLLLVLDNCEHVVGAAARLADAVLRRCSGTTVLATSRELLRTAGEQTYRVAPLGLPSVRFDGVLDGSAAELFIERARAWNSGYIGDGDDAAAIAAICRDLDGIPLAIEFAAAAAATLGVSQVAAGLTDRFGLLKMGRRTALPRHQTLRAALDWSYDLLADPQAKALQRLSVLVGDFSLDAAVKVAGDDATSVTRADMPGIMTDLVAKSLVAVEFHGGIAKYRLLDTIRHHAREKLLLSGGYDEAVRSHADHYHALALRAEAESQTQLESEWLARHAHHLDNWRAVLDWAFSPSGDAELGLMVTLCAVPVWFKLSLMAECRRRIENALTYAGKATDTRVVMRLSAALAAALFYTDTGATSEVAAAWTRVLAIADAQNDTEHRLWARWGLWNHQLNHGEFHTSLVSAQRFGAFAVDSDHFAAGDRMLGISLHFLGRQAEARRHFENVLSRPAGPARRSMIHVQYDQKMVARSYLPRVLWLQGFPDRAAEEARAVVRDAAETGHVLSISLALMQAACPVALLTGDVAAADSYSTTVFDDATRHRLGFWLAESHCIRAVLDVIRGRVAAGLEAFGAALLTMVQYNTSMNIAGFQLFMANALLPTSASGRGLALVDAALQRSEHTGEAWCVPELWRLRGAFLRRLAGQDAQSIGETEFRRALDAASRHETPSWALRAANSLARLMLDLDRRQEASDILRPVFGHFTEGFDTADLLRARQTLDLAEA